MKTKILTDFQICISVPSTFYKKYHKSKRRLRKEGFCHNLCIAINSNLLYKNQTQDKVKCHIHGFNMKEVDLDKS